VEHVDEELESSVEIAKIEEQSQTESDEETQPIVPPVKVPDVVDEAEPVHGKLLTPSDIISSHEAVEIQEKQVKILKRQPSEQTFEYDAVDEVQEQDEEEISKDESEEEYVPAEPISFGDSTTSELFQMIHMEMEKHAARQSKLIKQSLKDTQKSFDDKIDKLTKSFNSKLAQIDKKMGNQLKTEVKGLQPQITAAAQNAAKDSIRTVLPKEAMGAIKTSLDKQLPLAVQSSLTKVIQDSFKQSFSRQIVPAFESACQSMLSQLDNTLIKGFKEQSSVLKEPVELSSVLRTNLETARSLVDRLGEQSAGMTHTVSSSTAGTFRTSGPVDPKAEIKSLLSNRKYEQAFSKALGLQDLATVGWLCNTVDAPTVLGLVPPALSPMVLLSLLQQLAADLSVSSSSKLSWIREAAMAINPADQSIAAHIRPVLDQVHASLQAILPRLAPADASSCKLAMHVVRSQMSS